MRRNGADAGLPIVTRGRGRDTDEEGVEVELAQTSIRLPVDPLEMRRLGLSNLDVGLALGHGAHLGRELLGETHNVLRAWSGDCW